MRLPQTYSGGPKTERDLLPSEAAFVADMQQLGFGRFECLQILGGELVLPAPVAVRNIKFGTPATTGKTSAGASELRPQIAEFFTYVREIDDGEIRSLEVKHGLPFSAEIDLSCTPATTGQERGRG